MEPAHHGYGTPSHLGLPMNLFLNSHGYDHVHDHDGGDVHGLGCGGHDHDGDQPLTVQSAEVLPWFKKSAGRKRYLVGLIGHMHYAL